jgi:hypothetical protein
MKAFKLALTAILVFGVGAVTWGQQATTTTTQPKINAGEPNPAEIGVDSAQQNLQEVSVSKFEDVGFWKSAMSRDEGIVTLRRLPGGPLDKKPIPGEQAAGIQEPDKYVLGMKVQYYRRGLNTFALLPVRPLPIEGITKTISVWVVGRNVRNTLSIIISDYFGNTVVLQMGELNFSGWKQLVVAVPPTIVQTDYHYKDRRGIKVIGFEIKCDPLEDYGSYYIYFDDLRAVTDLFAEQARDPDDMVDTW